MRAVQLERVIEIANNSMTADAVKVLVLRQAPFLPKFRRYREWYECGGMFWGKQSRNDSYLLYNLHRKLIPVIDDSELANSLTMMYDAFTYLTDFNMEFFDREKTP